MVEKKKGGKLAMRRHLARTLPRLIQGGIAPFFILQSDYLQVCATWWRHTINHRLLLVCMPSGHGCCSIRFETAVTADAEPALEVDGHA